MRWIGLLEKMVAKGKNSSYKELWEKTSSLLGHAKELEELFPDFKQTSDYQKINQDLNELDEEIKTALLRRDEQKTPFMQMIVRAGVGGEEANMFAHELAGLYSRVIEGSNKDSPLFIRFPSEKLSLVKFEGGVHRVQRIPVNDAHGRKHTSTVSVCILPEVEEREDSIKESDLHWEAFRSSGPGGQSVNKTNSAVRLVHLPTGITITNQEERLQSQNKLNALSILRSRLQAFVMNPGFRPPY